MIQILFNKKAASGNGQKRSESFTDAAGRQIKMVDVCGVTDFDQLLASIPEEDQIILAGGDGTLNYFVNHVSEETIKNRRIDYYPVGTGNDFAFELGKKAEELVEDIGKYLINLPTVKVKGNTYKFINGVGYGIDGYCCEVGDEERKKSDKPVNYTAIAIKGILFKFKAVTATVTVDGETRVFKNSWLAPVMNGKFYGGGMMATPDQDRIGSPKKVSVLTYACRSNLKALIIFPSIFKGEHVKKDKVVKIFTGEHIKVAFDRPCACQIDGETILNVSEIEVNV